LLAGNPDVHRFDDIKKSVIGVIFMGTPHAGGNGTSAALFMTNIMKLANINLKKDLIKSLQKESMELFDATRDFRTLVEGGNIKVFTLYEGKETIIGSWPAKKRILVSVLQSTFPFLSCLLLLY
jgi:hypothetical protein